MKWVIYGLVVIAFMDTFVQLPVMPIYAQMLGAGLFLTAVVTSAYSMANMVGNIGAGWFIGNIGRRNAIFFGLLLAALGVFSYSLVDDANTLLAVRLIHGLGMAVVTPAAFSYLADLASPSERGKQMAKSGIAIAIAALLGPMVGGIVLDQLTVYHLFYIMSALLVITAFVVRQVLPATSVKQEDRSVNIASLLRRPYLLMAYVSAFILLFAKGTMAYALPLAAQANGLSATSIGILFSAFAAVAILVFVTPLSRLSDKIGRQVPLLLGMIIVMIAMVGLSWASTLPTMVGMMVIYGFGFGILFPSATATVVDNSDDGERSAAFGLFYAMFSFGVILGPLATGYFTRWGIDPFIFASIFVFITTTSLFFLFRDLFTTRTISFESKS
ncbi:MFS transporter [Heliorestis acidaminivorans]|uniref:MFS transporter n=1 Tax=Heliorestis acidaminivorans TaxID=553427 RepID=A0A6I0ET75_9FIRM|nr:MFS transporter [Heliorestis acidaminivorans]KAB2952258.1 MFS transporter [Heliorestis acidaminivorans]